jgi:hypothetical protein
MVRGYIVPMMALLMVMGVSGCGDKPAEQVVPVAEVDPVEDVEDVVEGGPVDAWVVVESTHGGLAALEVPIDWSYIGSQQALVSKYSNYSVCTVFIANFDTEESLRNLAREPGQAVVRLTLNLPPESDPLVGTYDITQGSGEFTGEASIMVTGGSTIQTSRSSMTVGEAVVTHVTDTTVSGTFHVVDNWTDMSGAFHAVIR